MLEMVWPSLSLDAWQLTRDTLHRYAQILGKIQLAQTPVTNHFWNVTLRVTAHGLATVALPYEDRMFEIELDLVEHRMIVRTSAGQTRALELGPQTVADFYAALMEILDSLGIHVKIWDHPVEIATDPIPFHEDHLHRAYDRVYVHRFFHVLANASMVLEQFRSRFIGKCSGVGFYWGTFDLSVARYSGRRVPDAPRTTAIEREGYSHEVSEVGFWPGDSVYRAPAFFALHYPPPDGYSTAAVRPATACWEEASHCFVLPYETIRGTGAAAAILEFCQSTYEAGAILAGWNRFELERGEATSGKLVAASS
jgi:hypothetical protein